MGGQQQQVDTALDGCRILVVEDEMLIAMELQSVLQRRGCAVLGPAPSVARALALIERELPDAALLDLNLQGQRATPVAEALKARGVPFLVVSGYSEALSRTPELRDAVRVDKPVDHGVLACRLAEVLAAGSG